MSLHALAVEQKYSLLLFLLIPSTKKSVLSTSFLSFGDKEHLPNVLIVKKSFVKNLQSRQNLGFIGLEENISVNKIKSKMQFIKYIID
jgi:hypothetical protein